MADIPSTYVIFEAGDYDLPPADRPRIEAGQEYLLTLKTLSPTDGTATVLFNNGVEETFIEVDNPEMLGGTGISERRLMAPSGTMRISLDATFADSIQVTLVRNIQAVK